MLVISIEELEEFSKDIREKDKLLLLKLRGNKLMGTPLSHSMERYKFYSYAQAILINLKNPIPVGLQKFDMDEIIVILKYLRDDKTDKRVNKLIMSNDKETINLGIKMIKKWITV